MDANDIYQVDNWITEQIEKTQTKLDMLKKTQSFLHESWKQNNFSSFKPK